MEVLNKKTLKVLKFLSVSNARKYVITFLVYSFLMNERCGAGQDESLQIKLSEKAIQYIISKGADKGWTSEYEKSYGIISGSGTVDMPSGKDMSIASLQYTINKLIDVKTYPVDKLFEGLSSEHHHVRYAADYALRIQTGKDAGYNPHWPLSDKKVIAAIQLWKKILSEKKSQQEAEK